MNEYDHNTKEHIEYKDILFKFSYVFFILIIGIVALEAFKYQNDMSVPQSTSKSLRGDITTFKSNVQDSKTVADTTYTIEKCVHVNPLTGTIDKFYGE